MLIRGAEACGTDMGILLQAAFQFTGKGLTFRLRGIVTQDQAGRTGKPGQAQPKHGACLQRQQGHEGQPAPAGSQHFHRLEAVRSSWTSNIRITSMKRAAAAFSKVEINVMSAPCTKEG